MIVSSHTVEIMNERVDRYSALFPDSHKDGMVYLQNIFSGIGAISEYTYEEIDKVARAVMLSHTIDDFVDEPSIYRSYSQEERDFFEKRCQNFSVTFDNCSEFLEPILRIIKNKIQEMKGVDIDTHLAELKGDMPRLNTVMLDSALLQYILAGIIQNTEDQKTIDGLMSTYKSLIHLQTGETLDELDCQSYRSLISRASGAQFFFLCPVYTLKSLHEANFVALFDPLVGVIVHLDNIDSEIDFLNDRNFDTLSDPIKKVYTQIVEMITAGIISRKLVRMKIRQLACATHLLLFEKEQSNNAINTDLTAVRLRRVFEDIYANLTPVLGLQTLSDLSFILKLRDSM